MSGVGADDLTAALLLYEKGKESAEAVAGWIKDRLHERRYGIVPDPTELEELKRISRSTEFKDLAAHASGRQKKIIRMGLRLRDVESDRVQADQFKETIQGEFDHDAVHLAQAVQSRAVISIRHTFVENGTTPEHLDGMMQDVMHNSRRYVFLAAREMAGSEEEQAQAIHARIQEHAPPVFVVAGSGKAREQTGVIAKELNERLLGYETVRNEGLNKLLYLFVDPVNVAPS